MIKKNQDRSTKTRVLGEHADCGGNVIYVTAASYGLAYCDLCQMNSHKGSVDPVTGERRPPTSPMTVAEKALLKAETKWSAAVRCADIHFDESYHYRSES